MSRFSWFASSPIPQDYDVPVTDVDLMADDDDFEWKGQESLGIRACQFQHPRGFQPQHILQVISYWLWSGLFIHFVGVCNALFKGGAPLCNHQPGHLLHVGTDRSRLLPRILITTIYTFLLGTAFGFLVFDTKCHHIVLTKATVNPPGEILVLYETTLCPLPPRQPVSAGRWGFVVGWLQQVPHQLLARVFQQDP